MSGESGHWERVYRDRRPEEVSWYEPEPEASLALIEEAGLAPDAAILDAGGGASSLAGRLLAAGYTDITVADVSGAALERAREELGDAAGRIEWVRADLRDHDFGRRYDLWHDRALLHFMVEPADREGYLATLRRSLRPGGQVVLATFGPQGPTRCSGLPVTRYGAAELAALLGDEFELLSSRLVEHGTPGGGAQQFLYARLVRTPWQRLLEEHGAEVSERQVCRYVAAKRRELGEVEACVPLVSDAGVEAEVDWGEAEVIMRGEPQKVHLFFSARLPLGCHIRRGLRSRAGLPRGPSTREVAAAAE